MREFFEQLEENGNVVHELCRALMTYFDYNIAPSAMWYQLHTLKFLVNVKYEVEYFNNSGRMDKQDF